MVSMSLWGMGISDVILISVLVKMSGVNLENYSMINKCSVFHQEIYILLQQQMFCDVTIVDDHGRKVKVNLYYREINFPE